MHAGRPDHVLVADPRGWRPPYDATVVERLAAAGAVVIGKTNLDEFAMGSPPRTRRSAPPRNPHDPSRVPGGSCGGSAAAVAAGFAPLGARLRHRRLDPPARGAVRRRRREADVRPRVALRPRRVRRRASTRSARSPRRSPMPASLLDVIGGHDPMRLDVDPAAAPRSSTPHRTTASTACASASSPSCRDGIAPDVLARARCRGGRAREGRRQGRRGLGAGVHLRPHRLLPDRPGRGVEQPRPLRRRALRPARRRRRHRRR